MVLESLEVVDGGGLDCAPAAGRAGGRGSRRRRSWRGDGHPARAVEPAARPERRRRAPPPSEEQMGRHRRHRRRRRARRARRPCQRRARARRRRRRSGVERLRHLLEADAPLRSLRCGQGYCDECWGQLLSVALQNGPACVQVPIAKCAAPIRASFGRRCCRRPTRRPSGAWRCVPSSAPTPPSPSVRAVHAGVGAGEGCAARRGVLVRRRLLRELRRGTHWPAPCASAAKAGAAQARSERAAHHACDRPCPACWRAPSAAKGACTSLARTVAPTGAGRAANSARGTRSTTFAQGGGVVGAPGEMKVLDGSFDQVDEWLWRAEHAKRSSNGSRWRRRPRRRRRRRAAAMPVELGRTLLYALGICGGRPRGRTCAGAAAARAHVLRLATTLTDALLDSDDGGRRRRRRVGGGEAAHAHGGAPPPEHAAAGRGR